MYKNTTQTTYVNEGKPPKNAPKGASSHRKFQQQRVLRK